MTGVYSTTDATRSQQAVGTNFYGIGGDSSIVQHIHIQWDNALAATITFEVSNFPEALINSVVAGEWIQENPSTAVVAFSPGGSGSATALTITIPGTTAGGCSIHIGNLGAARLRAKVVATVAGQLRIHSHGKE